MLQPALLAKLHPDKIWFLLERKTHWSMRRTKNPESSWICLKNTEKNRTYSLWIHDRLRISHWGKTWESSSANQVFAIANQIHMFVAEHTI
jgi:hypothetical protein